VAFFVTRANCLYILFPVFYVLFFGARHLFFIASSLRRTLVLVVVVSTGIRFIAKRHFKAV